MDRDFQIASFAFVLWPTRKKRNREDEKWSVSQVSAAIPCSLLSALLSLLQHCHGNDKLSCSHKFAPSFLWSVLHRKGAALLEVPSWGSQDVNPTGKTMEQSWRNMASGMSNWESVSMVRLGGKKKSFPSYFICNSWSLGEHGHLKSMEKFFLGLMFAGLVSWLSQSWARWERLSQVCCSPQNHFHTDMMEKWIISPPVHLQPLITWITVWVCCHTGLGSCDAA